MGRRRLYHTAKQKQAANRAKSQRSYEKRKEDVNKHRRMKYAKAQRRLQNDSGSPIKMTTEVGSSSLSTPSPPIAIWLERADRIGNRLHKLTGNDVTKYLHCVVAEFLEHRDKDVVYEKVVTIGKLQKSMYRYENEVLALAGMGADYDKVRGISQLVSKVVHWLEEVLCMAMVDTAEVEKMFQECRFCFQERAS